MGPAALALQLSMVSLRARHLGLRVPTLALFLALSNSAQAEEKPASATAPQPSSARPTTTQSPATPPPAPPSSPPDGSLSERRDPAGVSGLSPFAEAILRGDAAYLARNLSGAEQEYRAAIQLSPQDARGHLRLSTATFALGRPDDAILSAEAALRFAGPDARLRSDALRRIALIIEQTGALDRAIEAWNKFALGDAKVPRKVAPPEDIASGHIERLEARQAALLEGNRIRERILRELAGQPPIPVSEEAAAQPTARPAAD